MSYRFLLIRRGQYLILKRTRALFALELLTVAAPSTARCHDCSLHQQAVMMPSYWILAMSAYILVHVINGLSRRMARGSRQTVFALVRTFLRIAANDH
ncbi:uncharacterized protein K489DRAFT_40378 [Dissoconium aciculare CBS 342.82]|uniref:Uncharacterized protein n=1 Tax=Dissoconium aciculare CBS 342.82 TaxID=1314786 RepID=A0A6J3LZM1_9PEZI|nr:uncharacterized protein K489DRAFT_40378 [Dissoconium aciculare CBS 342.82]KAF1820704.1 hypothetical protein K489DRAFT_40378 [Dissoconium aciculare CBS 342.82]